MRVNFQSGLPGLDGAYLVATEDGLVMEAYRLADGRMLGASFENGTVVPFEIDASRVVAHALCIVARDDADKER